MEGNTFLILIAIGLIAGILGGVLGIGGAIIIIPALIYIVGMNQHQAIGTSLAVMLPPIGMFAAYNFYKSGFINIKYALIIAVAFMIGSYFSSKVAISLPTNLLQKVFSVFIMLVAIKMFFSK
jgi:uncharacterized membrane protein YfcA